MELSQKKKLIVITVVVLFLLATAGAGFYFFMGEKKAVQTQETASKPEIQNDPIAAVVEDKETPKDKPSPDQTENKTQKGNKPGLFDFADKFFKEISPRSPYVDSDSE